jgi:hypothetical protein
MRPLLVVPALLLAACTFTDAYDSGSRCAEGEVRECSCDGVAGTNPCVAGRWAGCSCDGAPVLEIVGLPADPTGRAAYLLDAGAVLVDRQSFASITVRNAGGPGLDVSLDAVDEPFYAYTPEVFLGPGEQGTLTWSIWPRRIEPLEVVTTVRSNGGLATVRVAAVPFTPSLSCDRRLL